MTSGQARGLGPGWRTASGASLILAGVVLAAFRPLPAQAQSDYTLEYDLTSFSSSVSQTSDYQVVDAVVHEGAAGAVLTSSEYTVVPVLAAPPAEPPVSDVQLWMLY